jgi:uncharacterized membrane protein
MKMKKLKCMFGNMKETNRLLLVFSFVSIAMVMARVVYTRELTFVSLVWNLFLAWIPFIISSRLRNGAGFRRNSILFTGWAFLWLLFYPNAPYIVTDLFHLSEVAGAPKWYDLLLIMNFALNGLILGILSLHHMHRMVAGMKGEAAGKAFLVAVIILAAFGVYLGRFERWNSWDDFTDTRGVLGNMAYIILHPAEHHGAYGFTLCFALFQGILYMLFSRVKWAEAK